MTQEQRDALRLIDDRRIGAILIEGFGWVWPTHIRNDGDRYGQSKAEQVSALVVAKLSK